MADSKTRNRVITGEVRLSFTNLTTPKTFDDGTSKYTTKVLVPKSDKDTYRKLRAAQKAAIVEGETGGKFANKKIKRNPKGDPVWGGTWDTLKDGDESEYPEDEGHWTFNVTANRKPGIVDRKLQDVIDPAEIYSGVYARLSLTCGPYNYQGKIGVTFYLDNVQKLRDGEPFAGGTKASEDFDELDDEDGEFGDYEDYEDGEGLL